MALAQARALLCVSGKCGLGLSDGQIAEQLPKAGGGHPTKQSIQQLRLTIASDPLWFPGKAKPGAQKRGRKPKLTEAKRIRIAKSDTSLKTNENTAATCRILYRRILYRFLGLSDFLRLCPMWRILLGFLGLSDHCPFPPTSSDCVRCGHFLIRFLASDRPTPFRTYIILYVNGDGVVRWGHPHCTGAPVPNGPPLFLSNENIAATPTRSGSMPK